MIKHIKKFWPIYLFFIGLISLIFVTYKDYGIVWDEQFYLNIGKHFASKAMNLIGLNSNLNNSAFIGFPRETIDLQLKTHGVFFDIVNVLISLLFNKFNYDIFHLIKSFTSVLTFLVMALISYKLFKKVYLVLFNLLLLLLFPRFYGEIYQNSIDPSTALCVALSIYYFISYLKGKKSIFSQLILSFILAVTINQRIVLSYIFVLTLLFIFLSTFLSLKSWIKALKEIIFISIATVVFMHITNPYLLTHPIKGIIEMMQASKQFGFTASVLFNGQYYWASYLPWYYLPKTMLISMPVITIVLFGLGIIRLTLLLFKKELLINKLIYLYLVLTFIIPLLLVIFLKPVLYNSWRQLLFLTIPIVIIATYGLSMLITTKVKFINILTIIIVMINLLITARKMIILHPYQYIYYNSLIGGLKGAYGKHETDYAGAGYKEAVDWFNKNINDNKKQYLIRAEGDPLSTSYYLKPNSKLISDGRFADYFISFTRWNLDQLFPGKIVHVIEREGVPLIFIKKLR